MLGFLLTACAGVRQPNVPNLGGNCDKPLTYDIGFARFDETAQQIAHATGCVVILDVSEAGAVRPNPVRGTMSPREALAKAIKGTGLKIVSQGPDSITVK